MQKEIAAEKVRQRKAKLAAMTPEERQAYHEKRRAEAKKAKRASVQSIVDRIEAAKKACGPDCYRVVSKPEGGYIGLNKQDYELYMANGKKLDKDGKPIAAKATRAAKAAPQQKSVAAEKPLPERMAKRYPRMLERSAQMRYAPSNGSSHTFSRPRKAVQK